MGEKMLLEEMSWTEFERKKKKTDTVLIPMGSVEMEGPHLPMGVDSIAALEVAKRVAEGMDVMVSRPNNYLNRSLTAWAKLLVSWDINPHVETIMRAFAPDAGKRNRPPPHSTMIYNAEAVKRALARAGPAFAALHRED